MQGMEAGDGNTLFQGGTEAVTGVYGTPRVVFIPQPGGGYRKRTEVSLSITREQLDAPPAAQTKLTRTDCTPKIVYVIEFVGTQSVLSYDLTLVNFTA